MSGRLAVADTSSRAEVLVVAREVAAIVRALTNDSRYRVFLFGSWVSGRARERSDIDVGIEGLGPVPAPVMQEIREACERLATLYTVDVVDVGALPCAIRGPLKSRILDLEEV